ncbi:MAG: TIGR04141 family sporadically distributed protein [Acidimicrobiaceae bacterium]|nr:TIGR04141 family sporadically distributed protein [Acidimicrobiaceae bacterium]
MFPFDRASRSGSSQVRHPDLRLVDYLSGLKRPNASRRQGPEEEGVGTSNRLSTLTSTSLRSSRILAIDGSGSASYQWSVWKCLVGEIELNGETFVLDEGDFFRVQDDYVEELNRFIDNLPEAAIKFPSSTPNKHEGDYNAEFADSSDDLFLLDKRLVSIRSKTTPIEICDVLTRNRELIHVKRHLGSSDLSHLFSQGMVSAELIQSSPEFRKMVSKKINSYPKGRTGFDCFGDSGLVVSEFQVVYAIIERWQGRTCAEALPFFSKVNLREIASNLTSRGFRVALNQIQA